MTVDTAGMQDYTNRLWSICRSMTGDDGWKGPELLDEKMLDPGYRRMRRAQSGTMAD